MIMYTLIAVYGKTYTLGEKNMKKSKILTFTAMLLILVITVAVFAGCIGKANSAPADLDFDGLGLKPTKEAIAKSTPIDRNKVTLSDTLTDDQAVLDSVKYLLTLSNRNLIECDFFTAGAYGTGTAAITVTSGGDPIVGSMDLREVRIFDNNTYYFDTYCLITDSYTIKKDGSHGKVADVLTNAVASALNYAKRVYSPNGEDFYFSKNGKTNKDSIVNFPDPYAVSFEKPKTQKMTYDQYMAETNSRDSYKSFTTDNYETQQPITKGLITYDDSTGIYRLECDINCDDETLEYSVADMLDIGAINEFDYAEKHLTIEIWDCGLIRNYINENTWNASMILNLKGTSHNFYEQWFMYDKSKLNKLVIPQELKDQLMK